MMPETPQYIAPKNNPNSLVLVLIAVLAIGTIGFGILAVIAFGKASTATSTLQARQKAAADSARADQKKLDQNAAELASESPFRSYVAPIEYGSFEIKFPKNWSATVTENRSAPVQVSLIVNPDFVKIQNNIADLTATRVTLNQRTLNELTKEYSSNKGLKRTDTTVAGVPSVEFTGKFNDKRTTRLIAVPIRDKTLVFVNENPAFNSQFDLILAQSRINP